MRMDIQEIKDIINNIEMEFLDKKVNFKVIDVENSFNEFTCPYITIFIENVKGINSLSRNPLSCGFYIDPFTTNKREIVMKCFYHAKSLINHEVEETFKYNDINIMDPHKTREENDSIRKLTLMDSRRPIRSLDDALKHGNIVVSSANP